MLKKKIKWIAITVSGTMVGLLTGFGAIGVLLVSQRMLPDLFLEPRRPLTLAVGAIIILLIMTGLFWIRCVPRKPGHKQWNKIRSSPILHYTTLSRISVIFDEGEAESKRSGFVKLRPSTSDLWCGLAAYCFAGRPSRFNLLINVGLAEAVVIIDPADVHGEILYRRHGNAVLLMGGYLGPARWKKLCNGGAQAELL